MQHCPSGLTYFAPHDYLHIHLFSCKWQNFTLSFNWIIFHHVYNQGTYIHSSIDCHPEWLHILTIVIVPQWAWVCRYPCRMLTLTASGHTEEWSAESSGNSIVWFSRNLHADFYRSSDNLHSHQQCRRVLFALRLHQQLLFPVFLMIGFGTWIRGKLSAVLIYNSCSFIFHCD